MSVRNAAVLSLLAVLAAAGFAHAACKIDREAKFSGDGKRVRLARLEGLPATANFSLYKAPLAVNTDGAPTSYRPDDFLGERLAIDRIDDGISIRRTDGAKVGPLEFRATFDRWRASPTWGVPAGYRIGWRNVIAANPAGRPCVFQHGEYAGYFGSLTALKNGLAVSAAGECLALDQLDLRHIPAVVLRGGAADPLQSFGAHVGDLVLAINPVTRVVVPAVVGDSGDGKRIGEGSVALNMALLGVTRQPRTLADARRLDTGLNDMVVAVFPNTRLYHRMRPYSAENLTGRVGTWAKEMNYNSVDGLASAVLVCAEGL